MTVVLTLDVDWAPDWMVEEVAARLIAKRVKATWFVTHETDVLDELRRHPDLFELGIHPNFARGSTHGSAPTDVLATCLQAVPEAVSMRSHGLLQSSELLALVRGTTPIRIDSSLFIPGATRVERIVYPTAGGSLVRVPFVWEDDTQMLADAADWRPERLFEEVQGVVVLDFHPVHVILNSAHECQYATAKNAGFPHVGPADVAAVTRPLAEAGAGSAFEAVVAAIADHRSARLVDVAVQDAVEATS